ncbi:RNA-binding domain-containing protein [Melanomma pulvis-pyrius CBS 109.77]|uniref:RNA-binding domain-containing protein n=1 Tax=Melanomma pulvis-pyrius CBS 109.77 TaxID=1314802 RepID=A0A6A6XG41_9PLEO|nr:RNA-binding domain-containing protein [Melanomma pulvis-pyrius CBS 109.77]
MAPEDLKGKKRKGSYYSVLKQKKVDEAAAATKKSAKALNAAVKPIDDVSVNVKVSRKRAADLFDDQAPAADKTVKGKKGNKKSKTVAEVNGAEDKAADVKSDVAEVKEKSKKAPKAKKPAAETKFAKLSDAQKEKKAESHSRRKGNFHKQQEIENGEDDEEDDQTAALLAGFESDNDEEDPEEDVEFDTEIKTVVDDKIRTQLEKAPKKTDEPGVIYVGRIPHGFYESQMRGYFKQFGKVTRLRVSRNKKTGASKHYAFVEFASAEVADIVARTMNNYLMFGHILQCRVIPTAQVNPNLFDGANTRFKKDPRNRKEGAEMEHGAERAVWEKRVAKEQKKRAGKNKMLKDEMDYEFTGPALKAVLDVPKNASTSDDGAAQQLLAEASAADTIEAAQASESELGQFSVTETTVKTTVKTKAKAKKPKKATKSKATNDAPK